MIILFRALTITIMSQSLIFATLAHADQLALPSGDLIAPQITHEPLKESINAGTTQQIKATITDNEGIKTVTLFYRTIGSNSYKRTQMIQIENTNQYMATFGFEDTVEPGIEYYIQAVDLAGNALLHGYSFSPLTIGIVTDTSVPVTNTNEPHTELAISDQPPKEEKKISKWLWIGLGVLALGAVAAISGGGSDDGSDPSSSQNPGGTGRVSFDNIQVPAN